MRAVVLMVDGLQPAFLGAYGCEWVPTPTIDSWAANGVVFDNHFSDDPLTPPRRRFAANLSALRASGVRTAFVGPGESNGPDWDVRLATTREPGPIELKPTRRAVRKALERLADAPDALLWVEIDALLPPWTVADELLGEFFAADEDAEDGLESETGTAIEPWTGEPPDRIDADDEDTFRRLQRTYATSVVALDAALGRLEKDLHKLRCGDAVRVLTSGSGFPLGEHGAVGPDRAELHEELVHLPFVLAAPDGEIAGLRVAELTQPPDLAATLAGLFGRAGSIAGFNLLDRGGGGADRAAAVCRMNSPRISTWSVRTREWYLLATDAPESTRRLYVKPDDRWEFNDVAAHHAETVAELEQWYRQSQT